MYRQVDPHHLVTPVRALALTIEDSIPAVRDRARRRAAYGLLARANLLAGRIAFFDMGRSFEARSYLDLAREAAQEAGDEMIRVAVFGHMAFLPARKHNYSATASYLAGARDSKGLDRFRAAESWLAAVEGEFHTWAGAYGAAGRSIDRARTGLAEPTVTPEWFDFFDLARLGGFEGFTLHRSGDLEGARAALVDALERGSDMGPKQQSVLTLDLAGVCVSQGDLDEACRLAGQAATRLHEVGYATATDRLTSLRSSMPSETHPAVRSLDEQLADLDLGVHR
jgi:hypothetical protein